MYANMQTASLCMTNQKSNFRCKGDICVALLYILFFFLVLLVSLYYS